MDMSTHMNFWLKSRGIMQGLCNANALIFKDENLHCDFAIHLLNNHVENKPSEKRIKEILLSALEIEKEFITESLPVSLIGMNQNLMKQYLEFVVDGLLVKFGCKKQFNVEQPFKFMEQIAVETKGNFFESRTVEYQKAKLNETLSFTTTVFSLGIIIFFSNILNFWVIPPFRAKVR